MQEGVESPRHIAYWAALPPATFPSISSAGRNAGYTLVSGTTAEICALVSSDRCNWFPHQVEIIMGTRNVFTTPA